MNKTLTISQIKEKVHNESFTNEEWKSFQIDERKGVQTILSSYQKKLEKKESLKKHFYEMLQYEQKCWNSNIHYVAGIDEAGRGPLAGPVVASAVVIDESFYIEGLNDSKQLSEKKRELFFDQIKEQAISYGIGIVDNHTIDQINIFQATKLAMKKAVASLSETPNALLIDAVKLPELPIRQEAIIKGDQKSISIAAASVLAKVTRDRIMKELDQQYPAYQFASNMGYGTKEHLEALQKYGPTPFHRMSFGQVKKD
ncbi:ribonuclease HII [Salirhabdus sp. Marseille-P4669]|uniref:ribonuclease HII n=1 Tax=Salirhabdus sp. Marseille-P4669 TaxID=2042310 RepID=UPI000C7CCDF7|nr:ribonuclease HII [Salirhabdus sp. Marseille-P4669]